MLDHCDAVTVVDIRPEPDRLVSQWIFAHLYVRGIWMARWKRLVGGLFARLLAALRRFSTPKRRRDHIGRKYARPVRFLRHLDRWLQRRQIRPTHLLDFYRQRGNVDRMLHSWDATFAYKAGALPVKRIELQPAADAKIGRSCRWRLVTVR